MVDSSGLHRKLAQVPARVESAVRPLMEKYARQMVAEMKMLVPVAEGDLRASIGWRWGPAPEGTVGMATIGGRSSKGPSITIYAGNEKTIVTNSRGVQFQNARLQEFGTEDAPANPYFYVTWRANRRRVRSGISRAAKKAVQSIQ